jgi:hypothetical protein
MGRERFYDATYSFGSRYNILVVRPGSRLNAMVRTVVRYVQCYRYTILTG